MEEGQPWPNFSFDQHFTLEDLPSNPKRVSFGLTASRLLRNSHLLEKMKTLVEEGTERETGSMDGPEEVSPGRPGRASSVASGTSTGRGARGLGFCHCLLPLTKELAEMTSNYPFRP